MSSLRYGFRFIFTVMDQTDTDMSQKTRLVSLFLSQYNDEVDFDISSELQMLSESNKDELITLQKDAITQLSKEKSKEFLKNILSIALKIGQLDGALRNDEYGPITLAAQQWGIDISSLMKT